jgi:hypothetical protein
MVVGVGKRCLLQLDCLLCSIGIFGVEVQSYATCVVQLQLLLHIFFVIVLVLRSCVGSMICLQIVGF